jgi:heme A synthase
LVFVLTRRAEPRVRSLAATAFLLVLCEVMLGALVIATQVPIALAVVHQAVGVLTFAAITGLLWAAVPGGRQATAPPTSSGRQDELALQGA